MSGEVPAAQIITKQAASDLNSVTARQQ